MEFLPIKKLKLREAFADNKKFQLVSADADFLNELFESTTRGTVFVHDDDAVGHSIFVFDTRGLGTDKTFKIENSSHRELLLWHIDGVMYKKDSKCDCAFLTEKYVGFVEFKANADNNTEVAIRDNYENAMSQILSTFQDIDARCKNVEVDICNEMTVEAFAVFNRTVPRNNAYQKILAARFLKNTDKRVPLYFKNGVEI